MATWVVYWASPLPPSTYWIFCKTRIVILENDAKVAIVPGEKNCIHSYHDHLQSSWNKKAIGYPSKTEATQPGERNML